VPSFPTATHSSVPAHDTPRRRSAPLGDRVVHATAAADGFVVDATCPPVSTATHSVAVGHDTSATAYAPWRSAGLHASGPSAGCVDAIASPSLPTTQREEEAHETARSVLLPPGGGFQLATEVDHASGSDATVPSAGTAPSAKAARHSRPASAASDAGRCTRRLRSVARVPRRALPGKRRNTKQTYCYSALADASRRSANALAAASGVTASASAASKTCASVSPIARQSRRATAGS
jgi:hypothetical protein